MKSDQRQMVGAFARQSVITYLRALGRTRIRGKDCVYPSKTQKSEPLLVAWARIAGRMSTEVRI